MAINRQNPRTIGDACQKGDVIPWQTAFTNNKMIENYWRCGLIKLGTPIRNLIGKGKTLETVG